MWHWKPYQKTFILCYMKSHLPASHFEWILMPDFFFFLKYMYHVLVIWKTVHWVLETIWMWSHLITKINKSHSLVSPPILSENLKVLRKLLSSQWRTHVFSNSYFHSKELNYWQHILSLVSLKITGSFYLQKKKENKA